MFSIAHGSEPETRHNYLFNFLISIFFSEAGIYLGTLGVEEEHTLGGIQ